MAIAVMAEVMTARPNERRRIVRSADDEAWKESFTDEPA
jgi:hypothetical protein